jgi:flagellar protein FliO/FliZ
MSKMKIFFSIALGTALPAYSGFAAAANESTLPVMSTLVSLLVVLAAIGLVAFLVKRIGPGAARETHLMRVVSQLPLGAREKISIVEMDDQWLVLGVTSQQITLLAQTARKEIAAPSQAINFSTLFKSMRGKNNAA